MGKQQVHQTARSHQSGTAGPSSDETAELRSALDSLRQQCALLEQTDPNRQPLLMEIGIVLMKLSRHRGPPANDHEQDEEIGSDENTTIDIQALAWLAESYVQGKRYSSALECHFECIGLLEDISDPTTTGVAWMSVGTIYGEMGELDRALDCYQESLKKFKTAANYYFEIKATLNAATILCRKGECSKALTSLLRCLMVFEALSERSAVVESLSLIGDVYHQMGDERAALSYMHRALAMIEPGDDPVLHGTILLHLGNLYRAGGNPQKGLAIIGQALEITHGIRHRHLRARLHGEASLIQEELNNPSQALHHNRQSVKLDREDEHDLQHSRVDEIEADFEVDQVRRERDAYRRQARELRRDIYAKKRELTAMSLELVRKIEFIGRVKLQLEQISDSPHETAGTIIEPLLLDLTATIRGTNSWTPFEEQCNELHHDFIRTLTDRFPSLTPTELKICALTRIDLPTKDIASLLFVTVRNVQNHRYRIRKKFSLDADANFMSFLTGI